MQGWHGYTEEAFFQTYSYLLYVQNLSIHQPKKNYIQSAFYGLVKQVLELPYQCYFP